MSRIIRFSQMFDPSEDRIAWITEDDRGETTRLWLSLRLCQRMVGALVPKVQEIRPAPTVAASDPAIQSWEQAAAMAQLEPGPPILPSAKTTTGLVQSIDIAPVNGEFLLTLHFGEGEQRSLALTAVEMRQSLTVLYRLYRAAEWPLDVWPGWVSGEDALTQSGPETPSRIN